MRLFLAAMVALGVSAFSELVHCADESNRDRSLALGAKSDPFIFGKPALLSVSYRNDGAMTWVVPKPTESLSVAVQYRRHGTEGRPHGYRLGRVLTATITDPDGQSVTAFENPVPTPMEIKSGKSFDFSVPLERAWLGHVVPGRWTVWIEDESLKLESNRLDIPIRFTADSVAACLEIAVDQEAYVSKRKSHAGWLQKIKPDLKLDWPRRDDAEAVKKQKEYRVQLALKEFEQFWEREKNSQAVADAIRKINEDAGLKAEEK